MSAGIANRLADFRAELDNRLMHLRLDLLFEHNFSAFENFLNVRTQLARLWIDNRELLLDAEREGVIFDAHRGTANVPQKRCAVMVDRAVSCPMPAERSIHLRLHVISTRVRLT